MHEKIITKYMINLFANELRLVDYNITQVLFWVSVCLSVKYEIFGTVCHSTTLFPPTWMA